MSTINLPKVRACSDITFRVSLEDNGVALDWTSLSNIKALIYSDVQKAIAGRCSVEIDSEDSTILVCTYAATKPQYLGINSIIIRCKYMGREKTYDKQFADIVGWTREATGVTTVDDPVVEVSINVEDVSTSLLDNAIAAAIKAAEDAEEAAHLVPLQVLEDCRQATIEAGAARDSANEAAEAALAAGEHAVPIIIEGTGTWGRWDESLGRYVDTGEPSRGIQGPQGVSIQSIEQTQTSQESQGVNVITVTLDNGQTATFQVQNGAQGATGAPGVANAKYKQVETLPTASEDTMDYIYLVESSTAGIYNMSYTEYDPETETYSWHSLGTTAIQLSDYATKAELSQLGQEVNKKVEKDGDGVTIVSDDSDTFYVVDSSGHVIAKIDETGIHSPNINGMVSTINEISGNLSSLSGDVSSLANLVASIFDAAVENTFSDSSDELLVVDKRGYIGLRVSNRGVEGVFLNTNTGGIKNDLRKQNNLTPVIGNYGADNAVYKLSGLPDVFRVAFDFRLNDNINVTGTDKPFVRLVGANTKDVKPIHAVPTDLLVSRNGETYTAVSQVIGFNSGFNVCGTSFVRSPSTKKPIVGDTAFSLWLKGNFNEGSDFPTAQEVSERASWLSSHSTAKIVFANDTFSVQGVAENDINVSIKDGNSYKGLGAFYDDLVSALGDYFVFKKRRLSASKTTADLLQFGELKLVANYLQQTNKASTSLSYNYDSFPVSIPLAIDESLHTVEIVGSGGNVWVSVDGQFVKYSDTLIEIYIGGTNAESGLVTCSNLEYDTGSLGDAIIDNTYGIVSSRTPRVVGVMQHLIEDKYEGEALTQAYYGSVSRMLDIFRMLENRGYTILSLKDVCLWLSGRKKVPARSIFFLATTNPTYDNFLNNLVTREIWTGASVPLIIGSIINTDVASAGDTDSLFKNIVSARAIGVDYITHLYDHDVVPDYKNSLILQQELYKLIRLCIASAIDTRMYSYGWSCESVNYYNMLSLNGFIGAMGGGNPSVNASTQYNLGRVNIDDQMSISGLSNLLI